MHVQDTSIHVMLEHLRAGEHGTLVAASFETASVSLRLVDEEGKFTIEISDDGQRN